ncbi:hypothetical protein T492DRAFT_841141 [Pavlovales sp. CCMP2436]|nr:hypothetical protein T492DRAFT_841141 [Pavlovales sp. CCMP2436]
MDLEGDEAKPDIVSLNTVLDAYKRAEKWEACLEFCSRWRCNERRIKPNVVSVNTAIKACKDSSQYEIALQLFDGIALLGGEGGVAHRLLRQIDEINPRRYPPPPPSSPLCVCQIIASCGKAGDWARALSVSIRLRESCAIVGVAVANSFISNVYIWNAIVGTAVAWDETE